MEDYKVPTVQVSADVLLTDGQVLRGTVFMPALSAVQAGPMPPDEWINSPVAFFPFRPLGGGPGLLLNKGQVLAFTVTGDQPEQEPAEVSELPVHHLVIEAGGHRFDGTVIVDMPPNQRRVVDYINRPEAFLLLRGTDRNHLIQKSEISRVVEIREA